MRPEQDAFLEALYREFFRQLWLYAMSKLKDPGRAEEVVQDTFHEAVKHIDQLMIHDNPKGWLMETAKHKVMHAERSLNRYIHRFLSLEELEDGGAVLAAESVPQSNTAQIIQDIKTALTAEEWVLIRRIALEKVPYKEVAAELGISIWSCQKRVQRIREKLKKKFPDHSN